jgi:hypothetical protein
MEGKINQKEVYGSLGNETIQSFTSEADLFFSNLWVRVLMWSMPSSFSCVRLVCVFTKKVMSSTVRVVASNCKTWQRLERRIRDTSAAARSFAIKEKNARNVSEAADRSKRIVSRVLFRPIVRSNDPIS